MFSTLPVDEAVFELEVRDTRLPVLEAAEVESASNDPEVRALAESTRPLVDVALFQFQATVLVALSIVDEAVAAAIDESVVVPVFINDPFQYRVLPRAYRACVVVAGVAEAKVRPF